MSILWYSHYSHDGGDGRDDDHHVKVGMEEVIIIMWVLGLGK